MRTLQTLEEGKTVFVQGYEFIVTELTIEEDPNGNKIDDVARFIGICTDSEENDDIRNSHFNGGVYGGNRRAYDF